MSVLCGMACEVDVMTQGSCCFVILPVSILASLPVCRLTCIVAGVLSQMVVMLQLQGVKIADACEAASVKAFPTWVINGKATEGQLDLEQLEQLLQDTASQPTTATADAADASAAAQ